MSPSDDDDEVLALSEHTLALLKGFYDEKAEDASRLEGLRSSVTRSSEHEPLSISSFKEDWHASQFWFRDDTAEFLARQLLADCTKDTSIAVVSAPSVYIQLRNLLMSGKHPSPARICLLEFDQRFEMLDGFVKYDFNEPTVLPTDMQGAFDRILWDPPYHSAPCMAQYAKTFEWLAKDAGDEKSTLASHKVVCTGETMQDVVMELFPALKLTSFRPLHTGRLDNRYVCLADFELGA